jgi:hypothetical protein
MKTKVHKFEVYVLDFEDYGPENYITVIQNEIDFASVFYQGTSKEFEWTDDHQLNKISSTVETWRNYVS